MASALDNLTVNTTADNPVSFYDYYNAYGESKYGKSNWIKADPNDLLGRINNWFTGDATSAKQQYDLYLTKLQNDATWKREDSSIQRQFADAQKAGVNPLALLSGSSIGSTNTSAAAEFNKGNQSKKKSAIAELASSALKILAIVALKG